ncbi:MAG: hypothetical protein M3Y77_07855 [Actinomycetota bacterium]|nr:hypothetical protein [Actinomycetota bacterium]
MTDPSAGQVDALILSPGTPYAERVIPDTLRTEVLDPAALQRFADELRSLRPGLTADTLRVNLNQCGTAARMLGDLDTAADELGQALELAGDREPQRTLARLRLAEVHRLAGRTEQAAATFDSCEQTADSFGAATAAVIHQHAGKFAFDRGDWEHALAAFAAAHRLRLQGGDPELIASSELALAVATERVAATP